MTTKHPGFVKVTQGISKKDHVSIKSADAILAKASRKASKKAKQLNPRLRRV